MNKYKELPPESETENYFKAGDKINVYYFPEPGRWDVSSISGNMVISPDGSEHHFKQCRKLEEVKPREIWYCSEMEVVCYKKENHTRGCCGQVPTLFREAIEE